VQRDFLLKFSLKLIKFAIQDPGVKKAPDPGSRGQKGTGSRI